MTCCAIFMSRWFRAVTERSMAISTMLPSRIISSLPVCSSRSSVLRTGLVGMCLSRSGLPIFQEAQKLSLHCVADGAELLWLLLLRRGGRVGKTNMLLGATPQPHRAIFGGIITDSNYQIKFLID